jgi:hypothetical protein
LLFATWGHHIHQEGGLIVQATTRHLLKPQSFTRIIEDPVCGEIFLLCRTTQDASMLSRYNVDVD